MSEIAEPQFLQHVKDPEFQLTQSLLASWRRMINASDDHGNTSLIWAAIHNDTDKLTQLAIAGADVNITNKDGDSAMMWAAFHGNVPAIQVLLQKGAELNVESRYGDTPLIWAAINGKANAVSAILREVSILLDKPSGFGVTALMVAAGAGHEAVVSILIDEWGADLYAADANGLNALMWAERAGQKKTADMIKHAMARHSRGLVNPPLPQSRFAGVWEGAQTPKQQGPREKVIQGSTVPVLLEFYADYCPPCRAISPLLDQLQEDYSSHLTVMKVDTTKIRDNSASDALFFKTMMTELSVQAIPTLALFREGECIAVKRDGGTLDELKRWIAEHCEVAQTT